MTVFVGQDAHRAESGHKKPGGGPPGKRKKRTRKLFRFCFSAWRPARTAGIIFTINAPNDALRKPKDRCGVLVYSKSSSRGNKQFSNFLLCSRMPSFPADLKNCWNETTRQTFQLKSWYKIGIEKSRNGILTFPTSLVSISLVFYRLDFASNSRYVWNMLTSNNWRLRACRHRTRLGNMTFFRLQTSLPVCDITLYRKSRDRVAGGLNRE